MREQLTSVVDGSRLDQLEFGLLRSEWSGQKKYRAAMTDPDAKAREILSKALGIEPETVGPATQIGDIPQWDSLAHMRLIMGIKKHLERQLSVDQILSISGFIDVKVSLS